MPIERYAGRKHLVNVDAVRADFRERFKLVHDDLAVLRERQVRPGHPTSGVPSVPKACPCPSPIFVVRPPSAFHSRYLWSSFLYQSELGHHRLVVDEEEDLQSHRVAGPDAVFEVLPRAQAGSGT